MYLNVLIMWLTARPKLYLYLCSYLALASSFNSHIQFSKARDFDHVRKVEYRKHESSVFRSIYNFLGGTRLLIIGVVIIIKLLLWYLPSFPTYLPTYLPTYIHTYIHTCLDGFVEKGNVRKDVFTTRALKADRAADAETSLISLLTIFEEYRSDMENLKLSDAAKVAADAMKDRFLKEFELRYSIARSTIVSLSTILSNDEYSLSEEARLIKRIVSQVDPNFTLHTTSIPLSLYTMDTY